MRLLYATAAALAPLLFAAGAQAQVIITTSRTTPIQTSNANNGAASDVQIANGGAINLTSGTAVRIDSNNTFSITTGGAINIGNAADGVVGVLVDGGVNTTITIGDRIVITDTLGSYPNPDNDLDLDGPWAVGSGRYGIRLAGPVTGNLTIQRGGSVQVEGNDSFGVSIDAGLIGDLVHQGDVRTVGDRSVGIRTAGLLDGDAWIGGTITATGEGSSGVRIEGDVSGRLIMQSDVQATGFRYTSRPSDAELAGLDADDTLIGGPAVIIGGNVAGGVLFDIIPTESNSASTDDDGDGITDADETSSRINVFGSAPAVLVGSTTQTVTLGPVGTGDQNFGFINRGTITGQGLLDGIAPQALRFGAQGGQAVNVLGGVLTTGTVSVLGFDSDATAVSFGAGATTPRFVNAGFITAATSSDVGGDVTTVLIEAGANLF
jgi:hypothetical protein